MALATTKPAIHVLLSEEQIAAEFAAAFERNFLDEKFFYWLPASVAAWVELCREPPAGEAASYQNASRSLELLRRTAPLLAEQWEDAKALCGIGCGEGSKDLVLLEAFQKRGRKLDYVAADFSRPLLEMALAAAAPVSAQRRGVQLDVSSDRHLDALGTSVAPTLYAVLGNTLGAFDPTTFPRRLRRIMRPQDRVIFDGEVFAGAETLRGYDNPVNRRFAFAPLAGIGLGAADGELHFELHRGDEGIHEVQKFFVPARDLEFEFAGRRLRLFQGRKLLMSSSLKYDEARFYQLIRAGGFKIELREHSPDGTFLLAGAKPSS